MNRPRLLVADANSANIRSLSEYLNLEGFAVTAVATNDEAALELSKGRFDGAVVGSELVGPRGESLTHLVRSHNPDAPVVTLILDEDEQEAAFAAGAAVVIVRPFHLATIATELRALIPGVGRPRG